METRILTLFDDDFFPPEPPKEKAKKEKAPKPAPSNTTESTEQADQEKDIIAEALQEFREKELKETPGNETIATAETEADETPEVDAVNDDIVASSEIVLEEVYHDTILEETIMADAIHFEEPQEPVFLEAETEPVIYSDEIVDDNATEEDIITSMEEENDVVPNTVDELSVEAATITNEAEIPAETELIREENVTVENVAEWNEEVLLNDVSNEVEKAANEDEIVVEAASENTNEDEAIANEISGTQEDEQAETLTQQASTEDKELNKQILSELIQLDYTALMQKEYAFDLNKATVINKELPKPKPKQEKVVAVEEEEEEEVFEDVTPLPEWQLDKKYYTIGEVAALFEVNTSHIRFWTNEFKLRPRTTRKGDRLYSPKDIAELRLIHHLVKVKKHTIKGAREKLKAEKTDVNNKLDLKESLVQLKDTLMKIREQL